MIDANAAFELLLDAISRTRRITAEDAFRVCSDDDPEAIRALLTEFGISLP